MTTKHTTVQFINQAQDVHGDRYDYTQTIYKHSQTKVKILCREHGLFDARPDSHLRGRGCPSCGRYS